MQATVIKLRKFPENTGVVLAKELGPDTDWAITHDFDKGGLHQGTMSLTIHKKVPGMVKACVEMSLAMAGGSLA